LNDFLLLGLLVAQSVVGLEWAGLQWVVAGAVLGWTTVVEDRCGHQQVERP